MTRERGGAAGSRLGVAHAAHADHVAAAPRLPGRVVRTRAGNRSRGPYRPPAAVFRDSPRHDKAAVVGVESVATLRGTSIESAPRPGATRPRREGPKHTGSSRGGATWSICPPCAGRTAWPTTGSGSTGECWPGHESAHLVEGRLGRRRPWPRPSEPHPTVYGESGTTRSGACGNASPRDNRPSERRGERRSRSVRRARATCPRPHRRTSTREDAPGATISRRRALQHPRRADRGRADSARPWVG